MSEHFNKYIYINPTNRQERDISTRSAVLMSCLRFYDLVSPECSCVYDHLSLPERQKEHSWCSRHTNRKRVQPAAAELHCHRCTELGSTLLDEEHYCLGCSSTFMNRLGVSSSHMSVCVCCGRGYLGEHLGQPVVLTVRVLQTLTISHSSCRTTRKRQYNPRGGV